MISVKHLRGDIFFTLVLFINIIESLGNLVLNQSSYKILIIVKDVIHFLKWKEWQNNNILFIHWIDCFFLYMEKLEILKILSQKRKG